MSRASFVKLSDDDYRTVDDDSNDDSDDDNITGVLRRQVGHSFGQVTIDGNARVHMGDMIALDLKEQGARLISQQEYLLGLFDTIQRLIDFVVYVTTLTGQGSDVCETVSHIVGVDHALLIASIAKLNRHVDDLDTHYSAFFVQHKSLPNSTTEAFRDIFEVADAIFASTVRRAISLAFSIESRLLEVQSQVANTLKEFHGFIEALDDKNNPNILAKMLSEISGIKTDMQIENILLLSCPNAVDALKTRSPKTPGKFAVDIFFFALGKRPYIWKGS